jgi:hypothetical protein
MIRKINDINLRNFSDGTTYVVSGTTSETITASVFIGGNTFKSEDAINIDTAIYRTTTAANTFSSRLYYNSTLSLTGAKQIGVRVSALGSISYFTLTRTLSIRVADGSGSGISSGTEVPASGTTINSEFLSSTVSNLPINWTTDGYLFSTVTPTSAGQVLEQYHFKVWTY